MREGEDPKELTLLSNFTENPFHLPPAKLQCLHTKRQSLIHTRAHIQQYDTYYQNHTAKLLKVRKLTTRCLQTAGKSRPDLHKELCWQPHWLWYQRNTCGKPKEDRGLTDQMESSTSRHSNDLVCPPRVAMPEDTGVQWVFFFFFFLKLCSSCHHSIPLSFYSCMPQWLRVQLVQGSVGTDKGLIIESLLIICLFIATRTTETRISKSNPWTKALQRA